MEILREYISPWLVAFGGATFLATFYFSLCQKRLTAWGYSSKRIKQGVEDGKALELDLLTY